MWVDDGGATVQAGSVSEPEEEDGIKPLPDRLLTELSAHRTLALRYALGGVPHLALVAALHALCLKLFYPYGLDSCLDLDAKSVGFGVQAPGLRDAAIAAQLEARHQAWAARLPRESGALWEALLELDGESRLGLFAHCVALTVNAVHEPWNRRSTLSGRACRAASAPR
jgi:ParB family chromosome partitioning protein